MQNRKHGYIVSAALVFAAATPIWGHAQTSPHSQPKPIIGTAANGHTVLLSGERAAALFPKGTRFWKPTTTDIASLEAALSVLATKTPIPRASIGASPRTLLNYDRQYIGIIQGGKKLIYVNAFWAPMESEFPDWKQQPVMVADGGTGFYNVRYDVKAQRFGEVRFNGYA